MVEAGLIYVTELYICILKFKSEDPGFDPQVGQGEGQFLYSSESTLVQTCSVVPEPPSCVRHAHTLLRMLKIPLYICRKRVGPTTCGMKTRKHCTQETKAG